MMSGSIVANKEFGDRGEEIAAGYLKEHGYQILDRNYRFQRAEIDLVCLAPPGDCDGVSELVFAEVKTRSGLSHGHPEEAVAKAKQRHIVRAARAYLHERKLESSPCRFDVISILLPRRGQPEIVHFQRAFWAS